MDVCFFPTKQNRPIFCFRPESLRWGSGRAAEEVVSQIDVGKKFGKLTKMYLILPGK